MLAVENSTASQTWIAESQGPREESVRMIWRKNQKYGDDRGPTVAGPGSEQSYSANNEEYRGSLSLRRSAADESGDSLVYLVMDMAGHMLGAVAVGPCSVP